MMEILLGLGCFTVPPVMTAKIPSDIDSVIFSPKTMRYDCYIIPFLKPFSTDGYNIICLPWAYLHIYKYRVPLISNYNYFFAEMDKHVNLEHSRILQVQQ